MRGEPALLGSALADGERVSGWARNDQLSPPEWSAPPLDRARVEVFLPPGALDATWVVTTTSPEDGSLAEVTGSSRQGVLRLSVEGPFDSIAFDAQRGELLAPICPSVEGGACVGPIYALSLGGVSLFADPQCPTALVQLSSYECRGRTTRYLSSCPSDGVTQPRSCVELNLVDVDGGPSGEGAYYDDTGALFDVVIDQVEPSLEDFEPGEHPVRNDAGHFQSQWRRRLQPTLRAHLQRLFTSQECVPVVSSGRVGGRGRSGWAILRGSTPA